MSQNSYYWPTSGYVFIGEENLGTSGRVGILHVVDATDLTKPTEVATFQIPGAVGHPHSFALDEELGILYVAWNGNGVYAIDVSGTLLGELDKQGRKIADIANDGIIGCGSAGTCSYSLQLHNGLIYVSDMSRGLMVLRPLF